MQISHINTFPGIKLSDAGFHTKNQLIPWQKLWLLDCIGWKIDFEHMLTVEELTELYVYMAVYAYCKWDEDILTNVSRNLKSAKTFDIYDRDTIRMNKDYSGIGLKRACEMLLDGKEVFCFINSTYRVEFYKQSQLILKLIGNPFQFLGIHGIWINLGDMIRRIARIPLKRHNTNDRVLQDLKGIYRNLAKGVTWSKKLINPAKEKVYDLIREKDAEIRINTNNTGNISSIRFWQKKRKYWKSDDKM